jgi:hypothetical protein
MMDDEQQIDRSPWWKPGPLTYAMWAVVAWCCVFGWLGLHAEITGNDAAGNGMATGLTNMAAGAGLIAVAFLAGAYLLIRWAPVRYACLALLLLISLAIPALVR